MCFAAGYIFCGTVRGGSILKGRKKLRRGLACFLVMTLLFSMGGSYVLADVSSADKENKITEVKDTVQENEPGNETGESEGSEANTEKEIVGKDETDAEKETVTKDETDTEKEAHTEKQDIILSWSWQEDEETLLWSVENQRWELSLAGASEDNPVTKEELTKLLPGTIMAQTDSRQETEARREIAVKWDLSALPETLYQGEYSVKAVPAGVSLSKEAAPLEVTVVAGGASELSTMEELEQYTVKDTVSPKGTTINLFDYWLTEEDDRDDKQYVNDRLKGEIKELGINKNHTLKFGQSELLTGTGSFNLWTGSKGSPFFDIVEPLLGSDGYPVLSKKTVGTAKAESLSYLFDPDTAAEGKRSFKNVNGLLQVDKDGYYYYDASASDGNYAYYDKSQGDGGSFTLYDTWGVKATGAGSTANGQFFPFVSPTEVLEEKEGNIEPKQIGSTAEFMNHYFGLTMSTRFIQQDGGMTKDGKPVTYEFSGDDDVWVFIDGVLVADLGGNHNKGSLKIDFRTGEVTISWTDASGGSNTAVERNEKTSIKKQFDQAEKEAAWNDNETTFADNTYHTLDFFYLERGNYDANMKLKFNLVSVPESQIVKTDQVGHSIPGAEFKLYQADEDYTIKKNSEGKEILLAQGTTGADGSFVLVDEQGYVLSINELYSRDVRYMVLRETDVPDGYRSPGDIHLYMIGDGEGNKEGKRYAYTVLLSDNHWETGAYALPQVTVTSDSKLYDQDGKPVDLSDEKNKMFAVVKQKGEDGNWYPVSGNAEEGWYVSEQPDSNMSAVLDAARKNPYIFSLDSSGSYKTDITDLPGRIESYYRMQSDASSGNQTDVKYKVDYYYTTAGNLEDANENNTQLIGDAGSGAFDREFSTRLNVPNIENRLYVQKLDEEDHPVNGAVFALYEQSDIEEDSATGALKIKDGAEPYKTAKETGTLVLGPAEGEDPGASESKDVTVYGAAVFEKLEIKEDKNGKRVPTVYYLAEVQVPEGYIKSDKLTKVVVDDTGVYADAGTSGDGITVSRGVGALVRSMLQFAVNDDVDGTLYNIKATLQTTTDKDPADENVQWEDSRTDGKADERHLHYTGKNPYLVYEPWNPQDTPGFNQIDEGWIKLKMQQCQEHHTDKDGFWENLENTDLTNLFSGIVMVHVTNQRVVDADLSGQKTLLGYESGNDSYPFTFLLYPGDDATADAIKNKTIEVPGLEDTENITADTMLTSARVSIGEGGSTQRFSFEDIKFKKSGSYKFVIKEQVPEKNPKDGIYYDSHEAEISIEVTAANEDGSGKLTAQVEYDNSNALTDSDKAENTAAAFTNSLLKEFSFVKTDDSEKGLQGASFGLYRLICTVPEHKGHTNERIQVDANGAVSGKDSQCWEQVGLVNSDENGIVTFTDLIAGMAEYRLVEYKAPDGYILPEGQWKITWDKETNAFVFPEGCGIDNPPAVDDTGQGYKIKNYKPSDLPVTGNKGIRTLLAAGAVLMGAGLCGAGWYLKKRKKISG